MVGIPQPASPGVYWEEVAPRPPVTLATGVPAFLGVAPETDGNGKAKLFAGFDDVRRWLGKERLGNPAPGHYLGAAVRGFFANGGRRCYVIPVDENSRTLTDALEVLAAEPEPDLVCAPDVMPAAGAAVDHARIAALQTEILAHCEDFDRFAILDAVPHAASTEVTTQRAALTSPDGALYHPWVKVPEGGRLVPPCGHVAGVYARCDRRAGVHKPPANVELHDVFDLEIAVGDALGAELNAAGVNCLRALPGRGIRIWGARTLSDDPAWRYVSVRRVLLTAARRIAASLADIAFEVNDFKLWMRVERELGAYFDGLWRQGALKGKAPAEAFYVRCDAEINPEPERRQGRLHAEIGVAIAQPNELIVVRLVHDEAGITLSGLGEPGGTMEGE